MPIVLPWDRDEGDRVRTVCNELTIWFLLTILLHSYYFIKDLSLKIIFALDHEQRSISSDFHVYPFILIVGKSQK